MSFKFVIFWVRWIWYKWRRCISDCNGGCGLVKGLYSFLIIDIDDVLFKSLFSYVGGWVYVCKKNFKVFYLFRPLLALVPKIVHDALLVSILDGFRPSTQSVVC